MQAKNLALLQVKDQAYVVTIVTMGHNHEYHTVKTFELFQTYFGHLSCMPVVYVTCCKTSKDASNQNQSLTVVEKLLLFVKLGSCRKPSYLAAFLAFLT